MAWQKTILFKTLKRLQRVTYELNDTQIAILLVQDNVYAIENKCPHQGLSLENGWIDEGECTLTCQWHQWKFNLKNGEALTGGASINSYKTKVEEDQIWIDL